VFDQQLRSRFEWLRDPDPDAVATPPLLMAFDLISLSGRDQTQRSLRARRQGLEELVAGSELIFPLRRLAANGLEAWAQVLERGYEGCVGKDDASRYVGGKTRLWPKVKVPGWTDANTAGAPDRSG
jgi:ATP-dependent DNA ligase